MEKKRINFTTEHFNTMCNLLVSMLLGNETVTNKMGTPLNVVELLHTTTINSLNGIRISLGNQIANLENQDEWVSSDYEQAKLESLKKQKELVNLIIGYKRVTLEREEAQKQRNELLTKIKELKESTKTPEDKLKELEEELQGIDADFDF